MTKRNSSIALALAPLLLALALTSAAAQTYPSRPVKLIMPYAPGGIIDFIGRKLAQYMGEELGQTVVAENRPGAGGILGTDAAARAEPAASPLLVMDPPIVS